MASARQEACINFILAILAVLTVVTGILFLIFTSQNHFSPHVVVDSAFVSGDKVNWAITVKVNTPSSNAFFVVDRVESYILRNDSVIVATGTDRFSTFFDYGHNGKYLTVRMRSKEVGDRVGYSDLGALFLVWVHTEPNVLGIVNDKRFVGRFSCYPFWVGYGSDQNQRCGVQVIEQKKAKASWTRINLT
ncbi:hypothetical protein LINPERPRIM_LOCUS16388 [Linum perenne]